MFLRRVVNLSRVLTIPKVSNKRPVLERSCRRVTPAIHFNGHPSVDASPTNLPATILLEEFAFDIGGSYNGENGVLARLENRSISRTARANAGERCLGKLDCRLASS
jgi:hypothetical protein